MLQWLFKQKYRVDRGYQLVAMINLLLLLAQSEHLAEKLGVSITALVIIAAPIVAGGVWFVGYLLTKPQFQIAEDRAMSETTQGRRDLDEIIRLLKEFKQ